MQDNSDTPTLRTVFGLWWRIGWLSFGGPAAQIALMHRMLVDEKGWLSEKQFLNALGFCMLLPGPEAMQLATYSGWRVAGVMGGLISGLLFVLPGAFVVGVLATLYALYGTVPLMEAAFYGIKAAVLVIVLEALLKVSKKALHRIDHWVIAGLSFVGLYALAVPFPFIILAAGLYGFFFETSDGEKVAAQKVEISLGQTLRTIAIWLVVWWAPLGLLSLFGADAILTEIGLFFSKLAIVTFGGAYAVLAYMAQDVVQAHGWLLTQEMMDGLALAETTPGPLILVTEFVGFLAGFKEGGLGLGLMAAIVTLWVTFAPCFLWIFVGAPYIEWVGSRPRLKGALSAITAAVVGVILNLSLWFAMHVFFTKTYLFQDGPFMVTYPEMTSIDGLLVGLFILAAGLTFLLKWSLFRNLLIMAVAGVVVHQFVI